jgi:hypothetical protein
MLVQTTPQEGRGREGWHLFLYVLPSFILREYAVGDPGGFPIPLFNSHSFILRIGLTVEVPEALTSSFRCIPPQFIVSHFWG